MHVTFVKRTLAGSALVLLGAGADCNTTDVPTDVADDRDGDGYDDAEDCAPDVFDVHPGAWEECDGIDNDCDGNIDELYDLDADGWLADDAGWRALGANVDCEDLDASIHPGATELDNRIDDDCDGVVDESVDMDGDGYEAFDDCDDADELIHPNAVDACDGIDNDCDGATDEEFDLDRDGVTVCNGDCDDTDAEVGPSGDESCDGVDNDCDGHADDEWECWECTSLLSGFLFCGTVTTAVTAQDACEGFGTTLAIFADARENDEVSAQVWALTHEMTWIGLTDAAVEGAWKWIDGSALTFSRWGGIEPNEGPWPGGEDCAVTNFDDFDPYEWADVPCGYGTPFLYPFLCSP